METSDSSANTRQPYSKGKRILVVDDEPNIVRLIKMNLERYGYEVNTAENGLAALAKIQANKPDLVITDITMPEMDGLELTQAIRSNADTADLLILMMGFKAKDNINPDPTPYIQRGASGVLWKPFNPQQIVTAVRETLNERDRARRRGC